MADGTDDKKGGTEVVAHSFLAKADSTGLPVSTNAKLVEDEYLSFYTLDGDGQLISPSYNMKKLEELVLTNNTLGPCIEAMVNNIDGTGYEIERRDGEKISESDKTAVQTAKDFFGECMPMISFDTLRKKMRRELESTGNGYLEIMRNVAGEIVFIGPIEAKLVRMAKLTAAVPVVIKMQRGGKEVSFTQMKRERRFAQKIGDKLTWFAEYGASRPLNKVTGMWEAEGSPVALNDRATELLHFGIDPDVSTPYFLPRWIAQTPSVVNSRQAEEHNAEFFQSGGIPPYLVIVQGGQLAEKTVDAVRDALNQKGAHARIQVIEAFSSSGSLDSANNVQVKVERFGAEKSNDSMFAQFDKDCEARVRKAFRLPPLLIGNSDDINFASAEASYLVAEAQVFKPEREEFDEVISSTILPEILGTRDYLFRSKPISIVDAKTKLEVIQAAVAINRVDGEHTITLLGEVAGVEFKMVEGDETTVPETKADVVRAALLEAGGVAPGAAKPGQPVKPGQPAVAPKNNVVPLRAVKSEDGDDEEGPEHIRLSELLGCTLAVMTEHEKA